MDTASVIGYLLIVAFLVAVIVRLWQDNKKRREPLEQITKSDYHRLKNAYDKN